MHYSTQPSDSWWYFSSSSCFFATLEATQTWPQVLLACPCTIIILQETNTDHWVNCHSRRQECGVGVGVDSGHVLLLDCPLILVIHGSGWSTVFPVVLPRGCPVMMQLCCKFCCSLSTKYRDIADMHSVYHTVSPIVGVWFWAWSRSRSEGFLATESKSLES